MTQKLSKASRTDQLFVISSKAPVISTLQNFQTCNQNNRLTINAISAISNLVITHNLYNNVFRFTFAYHSSRVRCTGWTSLLQMIPVIRRHNRISHCPSIRTVCPCSCPYLHSYYTRATEIMEAHNVLLILLKYTTTQPYR